MHAEDHGDITELEPVDDELCEGLLVGTCETAESAVAEATSQGGSRSAGSTRASVARTASTRAGRELGADPPRTPRPLAGTARVPWPPEA